MADNVRLLVNQERFTRRLQQFVRTHERDADRAVFEVATDVLGDIVEGWPVDQGVSRAAWRGPVRGSVQLSWKLTNPIRYSRVIEFGGYPGVGPKTERIPPVTFPGGIRVAGGIFPTQKAHAPVRRALSKHQGEITVKLGEALRRRWGR